MDEEWHVSEPFPSNEGRYGKTIKCKATINSVSEPFPSNEGRYWSHYRRYMDSLLLVSEPFPSNEGRYGTAREHFSVELTRFNVSEPFPSNEGRYQDYCLLPTRTFLCLLFQNLFLLMKVATQRKMF